MKKQNVFIFALLVILLLSSTAAKANESFLDVVVNGKEVSVREVPVMKNGKVIESDSPSFVYVDRTLVSVRLVAESYGAKVDWEESTETVIVNQDGKEVRLTINSDIAQINGEDVKLDTHSIPRLVNFGGDSAFTMVPINFLSESLGYSTDWDHENRTVHLLEKGSEEITEDELEEIKPKPEDRNQVSGVEIVEDNGKQALKINGSKPVKRNIIRLSNPERFVVDLMDSELVGTDYKEYNHDVGVVRKVRVSQFKPDKNYPEEEKVVRVVLDIKAGIRNPKIDIKDSDEDVLLIPEKNFWDNIDYNTESNILKIKNKMSTGYNINYLEEQRKMEIFIPSENVDLSKGKKEISDIFVSQLEVSEANGQTKVTVYLKRPIKYEVKSEKNSEEIVIEFKRDGNNSNADKTIVIDPGHGGRDPGASRAGVTEKDLMLDMSLKLERKLSSLGYNVSMTRYTDETLVLRDRPKFANDLNADLFISMHANASTSSSPSGIEVLYTPRSNNPLKGEQQTQLARFVQEELIKATGANDRGIKQRPNLVVIRDTKMPSILVEVGFISNTAERNKMLTESYQNKIVDAIVRGIERYFEIY